MRGVSGAPYGCVSPYPKSSMKTSTTLGLSAPLAKKLSKVTKPSVSEGSFPNIQKMSNIVDAKR